MYQVVKNILALESKKVPFMQKAILLYLVDDNENRVVPYSCITKGIDGSQAMIIAAIKKLQENGYLEVDKSDRAGNKYRVLV